MQAPNLHKKQSEQTFEVAEHTTLLPFLMAKMPERSRNTIKSYLTHRQIAINGNVTTLFDASLKPKDIVAVRSVGERVPNSNHLVRIVYEDDDILVVDKKNGVQTMPSGKENKGKTAFEVMQEHIVRHKKNALLYPIHQLERDCSGLVIFAKSELAQQRLTGDWQKGEVIQKFVAIIEGEPDKKTGTIESYIGDDKVNRRQKSLTTNENGEHALTAYKVLKTVSLFTLTEITVKTDVRSQVRVHMFDLGHPIAGDKKYGAKTNPFGRLCLHAKTLTFYHPLTGKPVTIDSGLPSIFR